MDTDVFGIDDLLDFSNDHLFSSSTSSTTATIAATDSDGHHHHHFSYLELNNPPTTTTTPATNKYYPTTATTTNFADYLYVPVSPFICFSPKFSLIFFLHFIFLTKNKIYKLY